MNLEQQWLEYDFNPFILFSHEGKIVSLNAEAQFLLGSANQKEIFELTTAHAPLSYGFKTTFLDIEFGRHRFFGITVGYIDDDTIGIKLYRFPTLNKNNIQKPEGELTNIFTIIDLCISSNSIGRSIEFVKDFDPTIPDIIINSNKLVKVLDLMYKCFLDNKKITTRVYYRIGEYIKYDEKKYSLFSIEISAKKLDQTYLHELQEYIVSTCFYLDIKEHKLTINLPIIT
ncbi:hypothetical protein MNB_SM-7-1056 [hydrothermal vent metagenome]|uniref:PAS domain-containing protein n=1 Tax=hydrothermal vent metagenome TaxID=652676 RepID=A0A1W1BA15_9ZZZZ